MLFDADAMHAIRHGLVEATYDHAGGDWVADLVRYRAGTLADRGEDAWPWDTAVRDPATIEVPA